MVAHGNSSCILLPFKTRTWMNSVHFPRKEKGGVGKSEPLTWSMPFTHTLVLPGKSLRKRIPENKCIILPVTTIEHPSITRQRVWGEKVTQTSARRLSLLCDGAPELCSDPATRLSGARHWCDGMGTGCRTALFSPWLTEVQARRVLSAVTWVSQGNQLEKQKNRDPNREDPSGPCLLARRASRSGPGLRESRGASSHDHPSTWKRPHARPTPKRLRKAPRCRRLPKRYLRSERRLNNRWSLARRGLLWCCLSGPSALRGRERLNGTPAPRRCHGNAPTHANFAPAARAPIGRRRPVVHGAGGGAGARQPRPRSGGRCGRGARGSPAGHLSGRNVPFSGQASGGTVCAGTSAGPSQHLQAAPREGSPARLRGPGQGAPPAPVPPGWGRGTGGLAGTPGPPSRVRAQGALLPPPAWALFSFSRSQVSARLLQRFPRFNFCKLHVFHGS